MRFDHPSAERIGGLRLLWQEAFGDSDAFLDCFFETAFDPMRCMCAVDDQTVVAAAYWFSCGEYVYIYAVATAKSHRGQGICHALMENIHRTLTQYGCAGAILVPGEESLRRLYGGMGYENFGGIRDFSCRACSSPAPLRQVSEEEFAALRRSFLPAGGVVQEGENLRFLARFAKFYAGADCLVTVSDGRVLEFLGNTGEAPGILAALGLQEAQIRSPGKENYAMFRPLNSKIVPTYFGFAFD